MDLSTAKRINILLLVMVVFSCVLGWRLFQKQVVEHASYLAQAQNQQVVKQKTSAIRGKIFSSDKFPLATNDRTFQLNVVPHQIPDQDRWSTAEKLAGFVGKSADEIYKLINNDKYYIPPLAKKMTDAQRQQIENLNLKGVSMASESNRSYPEGQLAAQILGFVDASGDGRYGLEGFYNNELKGVGGEIFGNRDTRGRIFDINKEQKAENGSDFYLTIDRNIQYQAEQILADSVQKYKADSGTLIVTEPKTGKILAMTNSPTFDPNSFNKVTNQNDFNNMAISGAWEPGSIFKPLIMAAAVDQGKVQPDTKGNFGACVKVDRYEICTSTNKAYGQETMTQVLENSDNVAMVWISDLLGKDTMYKYIKDFGFGRKSGIELDTENAGSVADPKKWSNSQRATISFGQGITATPLQILMATSAIANGGKLMKPYIVDKIVNFDGEEQINQPKEISRVIREDTALKVAKMMTSVVDYGHGKRAGISGYTVSGKTGTAQVPRPGGGYYEDRHIGSFVGFVPETNPRFAMIVRLNNPKNVDWAESSAAPTFGEMAKWLVNYMGIKPDRS